ncbi:MAG: hypothetical protein HOB18_08110 [Nitrospina sp.]|jgi:hypothetical protein|nr:hypothetical protein [Nitrospina sp.]
MEYHYPIKNWKKPEQYPDPEKMSGQQLAWEFIRRNPEYQSVYHLNKGGRTLGAGCREWLDHYYSIDEKWIINPKSRRKDINFFQYFPPSLKRFPINYWDLSAGEYKWKARHPLEVGIVFDLSDSIPEQLKAAKELLNERKEYHKEMILNPKPRIINFKDYWRVLDAIASGIGSTEIGQYLYPDSDSQANSKQRINEVIKAAKKYRDTDYRNLINR